MRINGEIEREYGQTIQIMIGSEERVEDCKKVFQNTSYMQNTMFKNIHQKFKYYIQIYILIDNNRRRTCCGSLNRQQTVNTSQRFVSEHI